MRIPISFCAGALVLAWAIPAAHAQDAGPQQATVAPPQQQGTPQQQGLVERTLQDAAAYYTAPLRWNGQDWEYFGGALAAIAVAHHYDTQARTHFVSGSQSPLGPRESGEITDALPSAALLLGTWGYASLVGSRAGEGEAWNMFESAGLSVVSAYALKFVIRRPGPDATTDANSWFSGGSSFPSEHTTMAFAIGTVLAESGNPEYRWIRRTIGYGVAFGTAYLRMKHNAHWLSDTVAGGALGLATAHFVMDRNDQREDPSDSGLSLVPVQGGVMIAFSKSFTH